MTIHDCPDCHCPDGPELERCRRCHLEFPRDDVPGIRAWYCSTDCYREAHRAEREQQRLRSIAIHARRTAKHQPVCTAITRDGFLCPHIPIRGIDLCWNHADDIVRAARDYGKALGDMAVDDRLANELSAGRPWPLVIECARRPIVNRERLRLLSAQEQTSTIQVAT